MRSYSPCFITYSWCSKRTTNPAPGNLIMNSQFFSLFPGISYQLLWKNIVRGKYYRGGGGVSLGKMLFLLPVYPFLLHEQKYVFPSPGFCEEKQYRIEMESVGWINQSFPICAAEGLLHWRVRGSNRKTFTSKYLLGLCSPSTYLHTRCESCSPQTPTVSHHPYGKRSSISASGKRGNLEGKEEIEGRKGTVSRRRAGSLSRYRKRDELNENKGKIGWE